jgi:hypothetical protein
MTEPVTTAIPLCLALQEAAETLDLVALTFEDATECKPSAEGIRETVEQLSGALETICRALVALRKLGAGELTAEEVTRLE